MEFDELGQEMQITSYRSHQILDEISSHQHAVAFFLQSQIY